jgi:hypothetical protein
MDEQIISRATQRKRGFTAHAARRPRNSHGMNPGALALPDWLEGWDYGASLAPTQNHAPAARPRFDVRQGAA